MKGHQKRVGGEPTWLTPREILNALGEFDLDPCAAPSPRPWPTAKRHVELPEDGLLLPWHGRVWLNPPFSSEQRHFFMAKMADHQNGIMLIPAATETLPFAEFVWKSASSVCFLFKRPCFCFPSGRQSVKNSGCSMCLVAYGQENDEILRISGLGIFVDRWTDRTAKPPAIFQEQLFGRQAVQ
jgi:hypothetical protein